MIFSIVLILFVLVVAFFHYLQGFMSSTISAILCAFSVLIAFTFYEPVVTMMSPGKFADSAHSMMLIVLFSVSYLIFRILFDKLVSGNVRVPATVEKVGGAIMGLIAGCLSVGLIAVAAQAMPFGPSIAGYARYGVKDESKIVVPVTDGGSKDRMVYDEFAQKTFDHETPHENLILPVDDIVVGFVSNASAGGMAGGQPFTRIHPDYLQELFGNRIGIELGAERSAQPIAGTEVVEVLGVYTANSLLQADAELKEIRRRGEDEKIEKTLAPTAEKMILVVRMQFKLDGSDDDKQVRVSPGSVRLVAPVSDTTWRQYFPVGTVEGGKTLMVSKPDDFLFVPGDKAADFAFVVDRSAIHVASQSSSTLAKDAGVFIEAKRYGRVDLGGKEIKPLDFSDKVGVLRKGKVLSAAPSDPDAGKRKIIGTWQQDVSGGDPIVTSYNADGKWTRKMKIGGQEMVTDGTWKVIESSADSNTVELTMGGKSNRVKMSLQGNDLMNLSEMDGSRPAQLKRVP